jgi:nucleoside 2-deoxyribosyltransferase
LFDEDTHRVYLAGPDVFFPDAKGRGEMRKKWCNEAGLEGVYPLDSGVDLEGLNPMEKGFAIYDANIELILSCEGVLADITPFRGPSADVGTAFEIGFGKALGLPIVCYTNEPNNYKDRVQDDGLLIEDFGMVDNLMLHGAAGDDIYLDFNLAAHALYRLLR